MQINRILNSLPSLFVYLSRIVSTFHFHFGPQPALFCVESNLVRMIGAKHHKIQSTSYIVRQGFRRLNGQVKGLKLWY